MGRKQQRPASIHLTTIILVAASLAFASTLILTTGNLETLWPLYVIPIVIAALGFHAAGAVVASSVSSALIALILYGLGGDVAELPGLVVGMTAFTICGLVIGVQAHRTSRHRHALEDASILDPLTGLLKREYLEHRFHTELRHSERCGHAASFLLVRVNCFDEFKTQFGSFRADVMLEHMGDVLDVNVRDFDIIGRYDPISFGLVLPCTGSEGAAAAASRIEDAVTLTEFEGDVLEPATHCSVSVAFATYPQNGCTVSALLDVSEAALNGEET